MGKTIILGNNPQDWWIKDIRGAEVISVPEISIGRNLDITNYILTLPMDADCIVIDADSLNTSNIELPLDLILHIRLMLHECRKFALSKIVCVTELGIETYKGYGAKSMVLMTQNVAFATKEVACFEIENSRSMTPAEYVLGFLELIKIEPQEKVEVRHSIANEWGADAFGGKDRTFGSRVENLISLRNQYIHPQKENKPRITIADYKDLFETVIDFLELFK